MMLWIEKNEQEGSEKNGMEETYSDMEYLNQSDLRESHTFRDPAFDPSSRQDLDLDVCSTGPKGKSFKRSRSRPKVRKSDRPGIESVSEKHQT